MELQTDSERPQGEDIKIPTPMELQTDLESLHKVKMISKFPPPWNFKLTWSVHKVKMSSKFPSPWNLKLTWSLRKVKIISKFPPPWNFTKFPPHGTSNWLGASTRLRRLWSPWRDASWSCGNEFGRREEKKGARLLLQQGSELEDL